MKGINAKAPHFETLSPNAAAPKPVRHLPSGYPIYCIYFPSGWGTEAEGNILDALKLWGTSMGKNLYVASWNIQDKSYVDVSKEIGLTKTPAIVLTDSPPHPGWRESLMLVLDDPNLVNDLDKLRPLLTMILQNVLRGGGAESLKQLMKSQDENKIKQYLVKTLHGLSFSATINLGLFSVQVHD
jgi:hypothetical protein